MNWMCLSLAALAGMMTLSCQRSESAASAAPATFAEDVLLLKEHTDIHLLKDPESGAAVAVAPAWQARVMTSTWDRGSAPGLGLISLSESDGQVRDFGGEEIPRLTAGAREDQGSFETGPFRVTARTDTLLQCEADGARTTPDGGRREFRIERAIQILDKGEMARLLGVPVSGTLKAVAYRSTNIVRDSGDETGAEAEGRTTLRFGGTIHSSPDSILIVRVEKDAPLPKDSRWRLLGKVLHARSEGRLAPPDFPSGFKSCGITGNYDRAENLLTLVVGGDPSVTPEGIAQIRTTLHLQGSTADLDSITRKLLGTPLDDINRASNSPVTPVPIAQTR